MEMGTLLHYCTVRVCMNSLQEIIFCSGATLNFADVIFKLSTYNMISFSLLQGICVCVNACLHAVFHLEFQSTFTI